MGKNSVTQDSIKEKACAKYTNLFSDVEEGSKFIIATAQEAQIIARATELKNLKKNIDSGAFATGTGKISTTDTFINR